MARIKIGKKFICLATSLMLAMSLGLAGCGETDTPNNGGDPSSGQQQPGNNDNNPTQNPTTNPTLTLDKESATLNVERGEEVTVTIKDCADFTVESSDPAVATATKGSGKVTVTAVGGGTATITVKGVDSAGKALVTKTVSVKVWAPFSMEYRADYTPKHFSGVTSEITKISEDEGVMLVKHTMTLQDGKAYQGGTSMVGKTATVYTLEVDLERADIVAGTKDNKSYNFDWTKATPYAHTQAWEAATGRKVYASVNADFFGATCVNAFVKDGFIVKAGHNAGGNGDYKVLANDLPASAPMLFGVKGTTAQIAPMIQYEGDITQAAVKKSVVDAKLSYAVELNGKSYQTVMGLAPDAENIAYISSGTVEIDKGFIITVDASDEIRDMEILETKLQMTKTTLAPTDGKAYIVVTQDHTGYKDLSKVKKGGTISLGVSSPDGTWNGYTTILGCRQALVYKDEIASTVTKENSNGAQQSDIPRTAVGVKNGKVVIFSVESLFYYKRGSEARGDTHGMDLPQLAEFAYYYGCQNAANFDGGGSTQLITHPDGEDTKKSVLVRSADYEYDKGAALNTTRVVMNSLLVTTKKK